MCYRFFFFFSSRRRHTRLQGDWSSDVCSSDLITVSRGATTNTSDYANNAADIVARGLEMQADMDLARALNLTGHQLKAWAGGYYHFSMRDKGSPASANTDKVQRMYRYEA